MLGLSILEVIVEEQQQLQRVGVDERVLSVVDDQIRIAVAVSWQLADRDDHKTKKKNNQYCVHTPDRTHSADTTDDDK